MRFRTDILMPPQLRSEIDGDSERHADWLELLFDLIFVAAISQVSLSLSANYSFEGFLISIPLFFVVWWGWVGHTFYLSRFGPDDLFHRVFTMAQMIVVASLAINIKDAYGVNQVGFALSYALLRLMLVFEYYRVGRNVPQARKLSNHYCIGFSAVAVLWIISIFLPSPWIYVLWGIALIIDLLTPITAGGKHYMLPPHETHLPERFGLFIIILIGETIISVVFKISSLGLNLTTDFMGLMGLIIAFSIWWGYFEESKGAESRALQTNKLLGKYQIWLYSHFPLLLGIVAVAAGIRNAISINFWNFIPPDEIWLICISLALAFLSLNFIFLSSFTLDQCKNGVIQRLRLPYYVIIIMIILTGFLGSILPTSIIIAILTGLCFLKVILSLGEPPEDDLCRI
ncbi:MAG: low temperature requirement protein A [Methanobacterium sp.]